MNALTPEEYSKFGNAMGARLLEHFDGLVIVGFHATTQTPVIFTSDSGNVKTRLALSALLKTALIATSGSLLPPNGQ